MIKFNQINQENYNLYKLRLIFLKAVIFFIPFQQLKPFGSVYFNITFLFFYLYIIFSLIDFRKSFSIKYVLPYLSALFSLVFLLFITSFINNYPDPSPDNYSYSRQLLMQVLFFWFLFNEYVRDKNLQDKLLRIFVYSIMILGLCFLVGWGVSYEGGRLVFFEEIGRAHV